MGGGQASIFARGYVIGVGVSLPDHTRQHIARRSLCGALLLMLTGVYPAFAATPLNFPPSDFEILRAENAELIGHGHYRVDETSGTLVLHGENRYLDGEYDIEEEQLTSPTDGEMPELVNFSHDFFEADGSMSVVGRLDMSTGLGTCGKAVNGKLELLQEQLQVSADTYAGASVLLPIQQRIAQGGGDEIQKFHVFNCAPGPKLIAVDAKPEAGLHPWTEYPGELEKIDIKPNFGFWTVVIQPFIPKLAAWFDPSQRMLLVGAQLQRFYKGEKIILVRKREASITKPPTATFEIPPP